LESIHINESDTESKFYSATGGRGEESMKRPLSQHIGQRENKQGRLEKQRSLAKNAPLNQTQVPKKLRKQQRDHSKAGSSSQTMDINKSIHLLSAYGEFDRFMALSKNYNKAKKDAQKVVEMEVRNQKKLRRKLKKRGVFSPANRNFYQSNPISIN
jgi:hypothetical protein